MQNKKFPVHLDHFGKALCGKNSRKLANRIWNVTCDECQKIFTQMRLKTLKEVRNVK